MESLEALLAKFLAKIWKVQTLLPFAAIFILLALITSYLLCGPVEVESESESAPVDQKSVVRKKFIVLLMIVVGALTIVSTFADFQFKVISQHRIQTAQSLAIFFGTFYGYLGILTLAFQLLATPALMRRLGLSLTLSVLPAALFIGNGFLLIIQSLWAVVFLKGSEQLFRFSLDRSSMEVIYLAIPQRERVRIKSLIDTVGVRLFEALGSGLLILLFTLAKFPLNVITVLSIVTCSIAIGAILLLDDEYAARLKSSVSKREFPGASLQTEAFSTSFHNLLPQIIKRSTKEMILNLLELLESDKRITRYLKSLIEHPDAEVRLRTLQMLSKREEDFSQKVENLLFDPDARVRQEAIHYVLIHAPMGYLDQIVKLTDDPNAAVRIAANAAALNAENAEVRKEAYEKLKMLPGQTADVSAVEIPVGNG